MGKGANFVEGIIIKSLKLHACCTGQKYGWLFFSIRSLNRVILQRQYQLYTEEKNSLLDFKSIPVRYMFYSSCLQI